MRAAVYRGGRELLIERIPIPTINPDEILLRVVRCGVCPTDLKKLGSDPPVSPRVFGHELAGVVAQTGTEVVDWQVGDRLVVLHHAPCGTCHYCRHGSSAQCPEYRKTGLTAGFEPAGGGFAEYVRVGAHVLNHASVRLSDPTSFDVAALIEPMSTVVKAISRLRIAADSVVIVIGQGPTGLMFTGLLSLQGVRVRTVEPNRGRRETSQTFGASEAFPSVDDLVSAAQRAGDAGSRGADAVVVAASSATAIAQACQLVRAGGQVLLFGSTHPGSSVPIEPSMICAREIDIIGSYGTDVRLLDETASVLFASLRPWSRLISHVLPLESINYALELARNPESGALKVLVAP